MTEKELAALYRPKLFFDKKEPFTVQSVGYTVFREPKRSASFPKRVVLPVDGGCVIEYAFWYDYDIQHLYELEHIWVYLDGDGTVVDAEGSTHGKYMRLVDPENGRIPADGSRVCAYVQPGKHAFASRPELFRLFPRVVESCGTEAGADGIAPGDMVKDCFVISEELKKKTREYIRVHFSFVPSFSFEEREWDAALLTPWADLLAEIPERMNRQICLIERFQ
ncbi:MAG: hypothetical protein LUF27_07485 [Lachnospiraceae bacterium]|nr:hypothetical protein [Lachnospiraceae bacterium]